MRISLSAALVVVVTLGACGDESTVAEEDRAPASTPEKHLLVNSLVDRFDAPACLDADLVGAMHRSEEGKDYFVRAFTAPPSCIEALSSSFETVGFSASGDGKYETELYGGTMEKIRVELSDDRSVGAVEWEIERE
ncbi:hypothetical protein ACI5KX_09635 [Erythrobacter sp. GH1-10]|uniref:hypothetical protein n=1 Tax=Erythrobacter sp. GH1-10 TaxID=3349334 RepID=UPI003877FD20